MCHSDLPPSHKASSGGHHVRGGIVAGADFFPDHHIDGADEAHLVAGPGQEGPEDIGGGGLAVGAGDPDHPHFPGWPVVEPRCQGLHRFLGAGDPDHRHPFRCFRLFFRQSRHCPLGRSLPNVFVAVRIDPFDAYKKAARAGGPGIDGQIADNLIRSIPCNHGTRQLADYILQFPFHVDPPYDWQTTGKQAVCQWLCGPFGPGLASRVSSRR